MGSRSGDRSPGDGGLNRQRRRAYTSVMSLLGVMTEKGLLKRRLKGRGYLYEARVAREKRWARCCATCWPGRLRVRRPHWWPNCWTSRARRRVNWRKSARPSIVFGKVVEVTNVAARPSRRFGMAAAYLDVVALSLAGDAGCRIVESLVPAGSGAEHANSLLAGACRLAGHGCLPPGNHRSRHLRDQNRLGNVGRRTRGGGPYTG